MKNNVINTYENADNMELFSNSMKCRAGKSSCWINWKGEMTPCVFLDTIRINVFEKDVKTAWEQIQTVCDSTVLPQKCCSCKHRFNCSICAASMRWDSSDNTTAPPYLCDYMDNVIKLLKE